MTTVVMTEQRYQGGYSKRDFQVLGLLKDGIERSEVSIWSALYYSPNLHSVLDHLILTEDIRMHAARYYITPQGRITYKAHKLNENSLNVMPSQNSSQY